MNFSIEKLNLSFEDRNLVEDLSLNLRSGELLVLVGKSGSGKTTILSEIVGKKTSVKSQGVIDYFGDNFSMDVFIDKISYIPQSYPLFDEVSVYENVEVTFKNSRNYFEVSYDGFNDYELSSENFIKEAKRIVRKNKLKFNKEKNEEEIKFIFKKLDLEYEEISRKKPTELSGGQRQRLSIACALLKKPKLIIMDEPFANLDNKTSEMIMEFIIDLKNEGISFIVSSHDIDTLEGHEDKAILISGSGDWIEGKIGDLKANRNDEWVISYFNSNYNLIDGKFYLIDEIDISNSENANKCVVLESREWKGKYKVKLDLNGNEVILLSKVEYKKNDEVFIDYVEKK